MPLLVVLIIRVAAKINGVVLLAAAADWTEVPRTAGHRNDCFLEQRVVDEEPIQLGIAATSGARIAKRARLELEARTGKKVVTGENYLPPRGVKKLRGKGNE
jgi:hypothetical protein